jgi:phage terminase large subunit
MMMKSLKSIVGKGYKQFWEFRGRYKVCKGGRGSKKSTTTALWIIYHMMKLKGANTLVLRKTYNAHLNSTYVQLKWAIKQLEVQHLWSCKQNPLELTYIPYGTKILFKGLDDPMSITSITVQEGHLCWAWFEEAFQMDSEEDFNKIDLSIRGILPERLFHQIILTFNPWSSKHWLKRRFFDAEDEDILAITTNYLCNEWLSPSDIKLFEKLAATNPKRYRVEGLGDWGVSDGLVFDNWREEAFDIEPFLKDPLYHLAIGIDFGWTDPFAMTVSFINIVDRTIHIFDEHYQRGMTNQEIAKLLTYKGYQKTKIYADAAEPKSIEELRRAGMSRIEAAQKGKDSIINGIQYLHQFEIIVHPNCENTIMELSNYIWAKDRFGELTGKPIDDYCHILDALRYSTTGIKNPRNIKILDIKDFNL